MTRILTNIPTLTGITALNRNMESLGTSLERLSTGLRINSGKDDPSGLVGSELLRSEMRGVETGVKNTERANNMIAVADSALGEVNKLLIEIRALITEAANTGIMTEEMLEANQLQIDASIQAIDRIAATTTFMGKNLLDGSLDLVTRYVDRNSINDLQIHEVRFGVDQSPINVNVKVDQAAQKAALYYNLPVLVEDTTLSFGGNLGFETQYLEKGTSVVQIADLVNRMSSSTGVVAELGADALAGQLLVSSVGPNNDILISAGTVGSDYGCVDIKFTAGNTDGIVVEYTESLGSGVPAVLNVHVQTEAWSAASAPLLDNTVDRNGNSIFDNNALRFTAATTGAEYNGASVHYVDGTKTQADFLTNGRTNEPGDPYAYYNDSATAARALLGNVNGMPGFTGLAEGLFATITATEPGAQYNETAIQIVEDSAHSVLTDGNLAKAVYDEQEKTLRVYVDTQAGATFGDFANAIAWEGHFQATFSDGSETQNPPQSGMAAAQINAADIVNPGGTSGTVGTGNTQNSGGDAGTLFIVLDPTKEYTANQIVSIFDLNSQASRGSERAAALFEVDRAPDNDGTGLVRLYATEEEQALGISRKTAFEQALQGGQTGGGVVSTAAEVVTALNNSLYWGTTLNQERLASLAIENEKGTYYDRDPNAAPPVVAKLAPGNHGLATVSLFDEVAYYGSPYDGTGLQFLGPLDSPKIRFVAEAGTAEPWIDTTTAPDVVDYASAVLNATNPNASILLTAHRKGEEYDDIRIQFKKATDIELAANPTSAGADLGNGWVEYDPGTSYAEALVSFNPLGAGVVPNTTFSLVADERGDTLNNVGITFRTTTDQSERVSVAFNPVSRTLDIALNRGLADQITANEVITAINNTQFGFTAVLSDAAAIDWGADFSQHNNGTGTFGFLAGVNTATEYGNTGDSGGHAGTITVWMTNIEDESAPGGVRAPTAADAITLINRDSVVGGMMFTATDYAQTEQAGTGKIDFINDGAILSDGGLIERGVLTVHLATDENGIILTTAKDLAIWWDKQPASVVHDISLSVLRLPNEIWDECNDPSGYGLLSPTDVPDECGVIHNDIAFVGWYDDCDQPYNYLPTQARGGMSSENGVNSTFDLLARRTGPEYNGYSLVYENDPAVTGRFDDNIISQAEIDASGNLTVPQSMSRNGLFLELNEQTKQITVHIREGATTATDIKRLVENDPLTKHLFTVELHGTGEGTVLLSDDTLLTAGGAQAPGTLNGAKLLFASDADPWGIVFKSTEYGSDKFVDVQGLIVNGTGSSIDTRTADGAAAERAYGTDTVGTINGITATSRGLGMGIVVDALNMNFTLSEDVRSGYQTTFMIVGGGATFQLGADVVTNQQLTIGIRSIDSSTLGGPSGRLYQLMNGRDADVWTDTNLAYRIVEESITSISLVRGRLGTIQKATLETNMYALTETLESLTAAESDIRDADFAVETSAQSRAQVLVQSNVSTLATANRIPQYMLSLLQ